MLMASADAPRFAPRCVSKISYSLFQAVCGRYSLHPSSWLSVFSRSSFLAPISLEVTKINRRLRKLSSERAAFNLHAL